MCTRRMCCHHIIGTGAAGPVWFVQGRLDLTRVALVGHSCGGATAALAAASSPLYSCGVALDPWW